MGAGMKDFERDFKGKLFQKFSLNATNNLFILIFQRIELKMCVGGGEARTMGENKKPQEVFPRLVPKRGLEPLRPQLD
ncbi:MAG TPA: hypothetical protein PLK80_18500, partial [bacterium]|nr:hypothetical protein [bacterium]HPN96098.1 hypothetical protein [bacterium]